MATGSIRPDSPGSINFHSPQLIDTRLPEPRVTTEGSKTPSSVRSFESSSFEVALSPQQDKLVGAGSMGISPERANRAISLLEDLGGTGWEDDKVNRKELSSGLGKLKSWLSQGDRGLAEIKKRDETWKGALGNNPTNEQLRNYYTGIARTGDFLQSNFSAYAAQAGDKELVGHDDTSALRRAGAMGASSGGSINQSARRLVEGQGINTSGNVPTTVEGAMDGMRQRVQQNRQVQQASGGSSNGSVSYGGERYDFKRDVIAGGEPMSLFTSPSGKSILKDVNGNYYQNGKQINVGS